MEDRRRPPSRERDAPDLLDELLGLGDRLGQALGERGGAAAGEGRRQGRAGGEERREDPRGTASLWTAETRVAYHAPALPRDWER